MDRALESVPRYPTEERREKTDRLGRPADLRRDSGSAFTAMYPCLLTKTTARHARIL